MASHSSYSCQENPMDMRAWWATVHSVAKSRTRLKRLGVNTEARSQGFPGGRWDLRGRGFQEGSLNHSGVQPLLCTAT